MKGQRYLECSRYFVRGNMTNVSLKQIMLYKLQCAIYFYVYTFLLLV